MSILSDAFEGVVDFFADMGSSSSSSSKPAAPSTYGYGDLAKDVLSIGGPLLATSISRPKALPMPERPKFPEIPEEIKNDPRMKQLLGGYGFPDNFPTIQQQELPRQSDFEIAFPAMFNAALGIFGREVDKTNVAEQKVIDERNKAATPAQVAATTVVAAEEIGAVKLAPQSTLAPASITAAIKATSKYDPLIEDSAKQYGIDPDLIRATIQQESGGDPNAVGDGGAATGLGQMHEAAANDAAGRGVSKEDLKKPEIAIPLIAKHLAQLNKNFGGNDGDPNYEKTISAYNAGEHAVKNKGGFDFTQVKKYRTEVLQRLAEMRKGKNASSNV